MCIHYIILVLTYGTVESANGFLTFSPVLAAAVARSESEQLILGESEGAVCEDEPEHLTQGISIRNLSKVIYEYT